MPAQEITSKDTGLGTGGWPGPQACACAEQAFCCTGLLLRIYTVSPKSGVRITPLLFRPQEEAGGTALGIQQSLRSGEVSPFVSKRLSTHKNNEGDCCVLCPASSSVRPDLAECRQSLPAWEIGPAARTVLCTVPVPSVPRPGCSLPLPLSMGCQWHGKMTVGLDPRVFYWFVSL